MSLFSHIFNSIIFFITIINQIKNYITGLNFLMFVFCIIQTQSALSYFVETSQLDKVIGQVNNLIETRNHIIILACSKNG